MYDVSYRNINFVGLCVSRCLIFK